MEDGASQGVGRSQGNWQAHYFGRGYESRLSGLVRITYLINLITLTYLINIPIFLWKCSITGNCLSPPTGHSVKCGCYTMMDLDHNRILDILSGILPRPGPCVNSPLHSLGLYSANGLLPHTCWPFLSLGSDYLSDWTPTQSFVSSSC